MDFCEFVRELLEEETRDFWERCVVVDDEVLEDGTIVHTPRLRDFGD
jgi:hypothetical protein